ncbi:AraC family transcriptional regulator [Rubellicoccus peritrichatus]|uniref:AraC family transcriptional regulator n=1 Tax=Rubellicoccus peritrichatus TaxID=3080537 RepID=A0AAQ3LDW5_9BACT|nr:AraC family transcriptional regulator [Puniceicoccus sp. CR14]WOO43587.1 AraC family transcriptional regulator [Puniceicoccus sp. CR14]
MRDLGNSLHLDIYTAQRNWVGPEWVDVHNSTGHDRLLYSKKGTGILKHHNSTFQIEPGAYYLVPSNCHFAYRYDGPMDLCWVHFNTTYLGGINLFSIYEPPWLFHSEHPEIYDTLIDQLIANFKLDESFSRRLERHAILLLFIKEFIKRAPPLSPHRNRKIDRMLPALRYVSDHLGEDLSVPRLAEICGLQRTRFSLAFKEAIGTAPAEYIRNKRIEAAQRELLFTNKTLESVASDVGLGDAYHFSRTFKRVTGSSPGTYRKAMKITTQAQQ